MTFFSFSSKTISIGDRSWEVESPIDDARMIDDLVIVLYQPCAQMENFRQFKNLVAFDHNGQQIWTAEHPANGTADCYIEILEQDPLILWNFACYRCEIDVKNGRLIKAEFIK